MKLNSLFLLLICLGQLRAQDSPDYRLNNEPNGFAYRHCLEEVHFSGIANSNYIPIAKDGVLLDNYEAPQFTINYPNGCNNGGGVMDKQYPIAYVSGTKAQVKAIFKTDCPSNFLIRGVGPLIGPLMLGERYIFPKQEVTPAFNRATYDFAYAETDFPYLTVNYWENFTISWQMAEIPPSGTPDEQIEWENIGESTNPLYVTYKVPTPRAVSSGYDWFHTLFKISCEAAKNKSMDMEVINATWAKLQSKNIKSADSGASLFYYKNWGACTATTTYELLSAKDGQCGSWARFFIDLLKVQGVDHSTINDDFFHFSPVTGQAHGFFVNNWRIQPGLLPSLDPIYKYTCIPKQSPTPDWQNQNFEAGNQYNFHYSDCINESGLDGQGPNATPESIFGNHQITQIDGHLLDPSYGENFSSLQDVESRAVFGYAKLELRFFDEGNTDFDFDGMPDDLNGDGQIQSNAPVWIFLVTTDKTKSSLGRTSGQPINH